MIRIFSSAFLAAFVGFLIPSCDKPQEASAEEIDTLVEEYDQSEMDKAIALARSKTDEFLAVLAEGDADSFSVKAPIADENGTEHFWLTDVVFKDGEFHGLVGNDPGIVKNVRFGQEWKIAKDDISDWMFMKEGMIHGCYTIEPLLPSMTEEEAAAFRAKLVR